MNALVLQAEYSPRANALSELSAYKLAGSFSSVGFWVFNNAPSTL